jgi:hypothetical protein
MTFAFLLLFAGVSVWLKYGRPMGGVLLDFAKLVDDPEVVDDLRNRLAGRTFLRGEFRGRKVVILTQSGNRHRPEMLVVSMETRAALTMDSHDFAGYRADREGELALFALEAKLEFALRLQDGCLKALWQPLSLSLLPSRFDSPKCQSVLEAMHTLVGSLERQAASS